MISFPVFQRFPSSVFTFQFTTFGACFCNLVMIADFYTQILCLDCFHAVLDTFGPACLTARRWRIQKKVSGKLSEHMVFFTVVANATFSSDAVKATLFLAKIESGKAM